MRNPWKMTVTIALCLTLAACTHSTIKYHCVETATPRISSFGFYIFPPPGDNWYEKHSGDSLYYLKKTNGHSYALTTKATEVFFDGGKNARKEMLDYIFDGNNHQQQAKKNYRNSNFQYTFAAIDSGLCLQYVHTYHDYSSKDKDRHPYIKVFKKGMVCRHPETALAGIDISFLEKSYPAMHPPSFREQGEDFLSSLTFYQPSI